MGRVHARIAMQKEVDIREDLFFRFADAKVPILSMDYEEVTLEKVFLELTGDHFEPAVLAPEESGGEVSAEEAPAEESVPAPEPKPEETSAEPAKNGNDDDYTPLFGGN